ncbi:hypothetical protein [Hydrogenophaga sp.]|uniref:hypothetical protein n=1 Tax=Hydrogenophaga sp. TaxID=1904254 RepID=UPI00271E6BB5|nr:hypothetical protein [Hydrogenophaga sp.]MDO8906470.1 hypothetical protein [Hydrogenophaga sp.]
MNPTGVNRRTLLAVGGVGAVSVLAGCALPSPGPRTLEISEARLVERIAVQFPVQRRFMEVFELSLNTPRVRLLPEENRIGTELDYVLGVAGRPSARAARGKLTLSFGLRIDNPDQTVRLHEVRVDDFDVPGLPPPIGQHASRMGGVLVEDLLRDFVVYRIRPEDLKAFGRWGYEPGPVTVVPGGLQLRLDPVQTP